MKHQLSLWLALQLGLAALLLCFVQEAEAGKVPYKGVQVLPDHTSMLRVGMFSPDEAPSKSSPGKGRSFIETKMSIERDETSKEGKLYFLVMHSDNKKYLGAIGEDNKVHMCCTEELYLNSSCSMPGDLILQPPAETQNLWNQTLVFPANVTSLTTEQFHDITKSGMYYAYFINCKSSPVGNVKLNGKITFMNPYGYLNGELYYNLPFYGVLCLAYIALGFIWLFLSLRNRKEVLRLQNYIGGLIALGIVETAAHYFDHLGYNNIGENYTGAMIVGVLFSTVKKTISRVLVLVVCMGYGVVKPTLGTESYRVALLGIFYFVFSCVLNVVELVQRSAYIPLTVLVFLVIPVAFLDTWFYWWTIVSLLRTITQLQTRKQTVKLQMYQSFLKALISFGVVCAIVVFADTIVTVTASEDSDLKTGWIWLAFWHLLYLAILVAIAIIWRPNPHNARYAYSEMDHDEDAIEDHITLHTLSPTTSHRKTAQVSSQDDDDRPYMSDSAAKSENQKKDTPASFTIDDDDEDSKLR